MRALDANRSVGHISGAEAVRFLVTYPVFLGLVLAGLALLLGGCATPNFYSVKVEGLPSSQPPKPASFRFFRPLVKPEDEAIYQEATKVVRRALASKGIAEARNGTEPELVITVSCGLARLSAKNTTTSEPVFITVPGALRSGRVPAGTDARGNTLFQTVTIQDPPRQEFVGYSNRPVVTESFAKMLRVRVLQNPRSDESLAAVATWAKAWGFDATYESEDKDLRKILPVLAAAGMVNFGKSSNGPTTLRLTETDRALLLIRQDK